MRILCAFCQLAVLLTYHYYSSNLVCFQSWCFGTLIRFLQLYGSTQTQTVLLQSKFTILRLFSSCIFLMSSKLSYSMLPAWWICSPAAFVPLKSLPPTKLPSRIRSSIHYSITRFFIKPALLLSIFSLYTVGLQKLIKLHSCVNKWQIITWLGMRCPDGQTFSLLGSGLVCHALSFKHFTGITNFWPINILPFRF